MIYLKWFKWAELGITGKNNGNKLCRLTRAFLALNHVKLYKGKGQKSLIFKMLRLSGIQLQQTAGWMTL